MASPAFLRRAELVIPEEKIQKGFPQTGYFFESMSMPGVGDRQIQKLKSSKKG